MTQRMTLDGRILHLLREGPKTLDDLSRLTLSDPTRCRNALQHLHVCSRPVPGPKGRKRLLFRLMTGKELAMSRAEHAKISNAMEGR